MMGRRAYLTHNMEDCLFIKREVSASGRKTRMIESRDMRTEEDDLADQFDEFYKECEIHNDANRIIHHRII